jgi:hypothetical protein
MTLVGAALGATPRSRRAAERRGRRERQDRAEQWVHAPRSERRSRGTTCCWLRRAAVVGSSDGPDEPPRQPIRLAFTHQRSGPVGTTILRMTRKTAGSGFASTLALAAALNDRGTAARETPASRAAVPKNPGSWREGPSRTRSILLLPRPPRDRRSHRAFGTMRRCRAVSGSFAVPICQIVVPTGRGAMMQAACQRVRGTPP